MALSKEKREYWSKRIEKRFAQEIRSVYSTKDPNLLRHIEDEARAIAAKNIGLDATMTEFVRVESEFVQLCSRRSKAYRSLVSAFRGCEPKDGTTIEYDVLPHDLETAIKEASKPVIQQLLSKDPLGREILRLLEIKEKFIKFLWLGQTTAEDIQRLFSLMFGKRDPKKGDSKQASQTNGLTT